MNKLLLFHLLFVLYSENAKSNDISLKESIGDALYFTQEISNPACFYAEDNFQGESVCLTPPEIMDLYNAEKYDLNDKISSISIPENVQVTIYENDNFNPHYYNLTESVDLAWLEKMNMAGKISAIKTSDAPSFCAQNCVVIKENKVNLNS
ncbi:TPA: beta/gamma crystallin domain-containing protein, partial [Yersinia enterocolitica]